MITTIFWAVYLVLRIKTKCVFYSVFYTKEICKDYKLLTWQGFSVGGRTVLQKYAHTHTHLFASPCRHQKHLAAGKTTSLPVFLLSEHRTSISWCERETVSLSSPKSRRNSTPTQMSRSHKEAMQVHMPTRIHKTSRNRRYNLELKLSLVWAQSQCKYKEEFRLVLWWRGL